MQVFTPEGALATAFERQQENKSLYSSLQLGSINPVAPLKKFSLSKETLSTAQSAAENRSSPSTHPSGPLGALERALLTDAQRTRILEEILEGETAINPSLTRNLPRIKAPAQRNSREVA